MAPLIHHNVPDDECYIGEDGIKRPYAIIFNPCVGVPVCVARDAKALLTRCTRHDGGHSGPRARRNVAESGSFGKSTRRTRTRMGTPARGGPRENPTLAAADRLFGDWVSSQSAAAAAAVSSQRKGSSGQSQQQAQDDDGSAAVPLAPQRAAQSHPVEMMLRGYRSSQQQYAAIAKYEELAGLILEDYARDPPVTQRQYKSDLRDPAFTRRRALSPEERAMVNRTDGGEHWVKVTFESAEAAAAAAFSSPQRVLGCLVHAEPYRGAPPLHDEACPDMDDLDGLEAGLRNGRWPGMPAAGATATPRRKSVGASGMPTAFTSRLLDLSPPGSRTSSQTMDTATISASRTSSATMADSNAPYPPLPATTDGPPDQDAIYCRRIPTARRVRLLPAEQALLPQQSTVQRLAGSVPLLKWFSGTMIGNEVPRSDAGDFDWGRASLYWKVVWWLDATFGLFGGDVCAVDKDD